MVAATHALPQGFHEDKMLNENPTLGLLMQMVHLPDGALPATPRLCKLFYCACSLQM